MGHVSGQRCHMLAVLSKCCKSRISSRWRAPSTGIILPGICRDAVERKGEIPPSFWRWNQSASSERTGALCQQGISREDANAAPGVGKVPSPHQAGVGFHFLCERSAAVLDVNHG